LPWCHCPSRREAELRIAFVVPGLTLSGGVLAVIGFANGLSARGHHVVLVSPRVSDEVLDSIDRQVRLVWTASRLRPAPGKTVVNALLALDLLARVPRSDVIVATYTPTAVPAFVAAVARRSRTMWLYADYLEMFERRPIERWTIRLLAPRFHSIVTYSKASVDELRSFCGASATVVGLGLPGGDVLQPPSGGESRSTTALYVGDSRPRK
jgi:hypothetical protein